VENHSESYCVVKFTGATPVPFNSRPVETDLDPLPGVTNLRISSTRYRPLLLLLHAELMTQFIQASLILQTGRPY
jgi:hypothetical protein